jgi:hypothetical protein
MVRRVKQDDIVGVLEFGGKTDEDPEVIQWLADHKARNGGKIRVSKGVSGVRVAFSKDADMAYWKARSESAARGKKTPAS